MLCCQVVQVLALKFYLTLAAAEVSSKSIETEFGTIFAETDK